MCEWCGLFKDDFDAKRKEKPQRIAILTRPLRGKLTRWRKGERVYVRHVIGSNYAIEKIKRNRKQGMIIGPGRRREGLACMNGLVGVPRSALEFV